MVVLRSSAALITNSIYIFRMDQVQLLSRFVISPGDGFNYLFYLFAALQTLPRVNKDHLFYFHFVRQTVNDQG